MTQTGGWWSDLVDSTAPSGSIHGNYATKVTVNWEKNLAYVGASCTTMTQMNFLEDNNAYEHMNPEMKERYDSMLKDITKVMDEYGDGGYNGISRKSMLLSQNMIAQLEFFNTNYVPDYLQDDFQKLIEECDYFNQNSREKMFADRMPCDIVLKGLGGGLVNKEKSAVVRNYLEYNRREKDEIRESFSDLKGKRNLSDIYVTLQNLEKWYCRYDANADAKNIFSIMKISWKKLI